MTRLRGSRQQFCRLDNALLAAATGRRAPAARGRLDPEHPCVRAAARRAGLDVAAYLAAYRAGPI